MEQTPRQQIRRYNYLFGETEAAYHEAFLKLGLSP